MTENVSRWLDQILEKLKKLDGIQDALENFESKLGNLEFRAKQLKEVQQGNEHDMSFIKESLSMNENNLKKMTTKLKTSAETELGNLAREVKDLEK